jgi:hypothetical protein
MLASLIHAADGAGELRTDITRKDPEAQEATAKNTCKII